MIVVGGTYWEQCLRPEWSELRGSGLRAAIALAEVCDVDFRTVIDAEKKPLLEEYCGTYGISLSTSEIEVTPRFQYVTPLAVPMINPRPDLMLRSTITAEGDAFACFGMLESELHITAKTVVYDPQHPRPKGRAQIKAERLAIVANGDELLGWAGADDVISAAKDVMSAENADVVIAKRGLRGALVCSAEGAATVPAFVGSAAWTLGSGDIFSAAFAHFWINEKASAVAAAERASRAVAFYVSFRTHPAFHEDNLTDFNVPIAPIEGNVYLAGPFFSLAERWLVEEARANLSDLGLVVNSPYHSTSSPDPHVFAPADIELIRSSSRVFALLDGCDPGTLFEIGVAQERGIPVIGYSRNANALSDERLNMLRGLDIELYDDYGFALYRTLQVGKQ